MVRNWRTWWWATDWTSHWLSIRWHRQERGKRHWSWEDQLLLQARRVAWRRTVCLQDWRQALSQLRRDDHAFLNYLLNYGITKIYTQEEIPLHPHRRYQRQLVSRARRKNMSLEITPLCIWRHCSHRAQWNLGSSSARSLMWLWYRSYVDLRLRSAPALSRKRSVLNLRNRRAHEACWYWI